MTKHLTVAALAAALLAPAQATAQNPMTQSMRGLFETTVDNITQTANILDQEMYAYRPTDEVRSAGEILAHVANAQYLFCSAAAGESSPNSANLEETLTTKAETIAALEEAFAYCAGVFDGTTDANAATGVTFFGGPNTRGGVLAFNSAHNYEHYGNLVTYMRINGIVPPSSR